MTHEIDEPSSAGEWLDMIDDAERYFSGWQGKADNIDRLYADLERKAGNVRDREFSLFWSNIQVMLPAIYARPPVPVVTPKFKDRRPLYRTASEFLERDCTVSFDLSNIDSTCNALRDDLAIIGRGAAWVRYEDDDDGERVCYEHVDRCDFLHEPARRWCEVSWVARRGWLTRKEMRERFGEEAAMHANYSTRPGANEVLGAATDHREKCGVWEIWHKPTNTVVWVSEGLDQVLDEDEPHLVLNGFFPCPKPVYATLQRRTLIPVPDMVFYKDQLEEINDLTARMHALGKALVVKGFYQAGGEIGDAVEAAMSLHDDGKIMVPVSSTAAFGNGDAIIWMPIDQVAQTIIACAELRRQLIDDVYQIVGLSDIMRGQTQADETYGAQRIKQQNGSARVRDKQQALIRIARDLVRLGAEIMTEKFDRDTLVEMAQMDLPTDAEVKKQVKELEGQAKEELQGLADQAEGALQQGQADPEQAQQFQQQQQAVIQKWGQQIAKAGEQVTVDQVMEFLKDEKLRPFVLDIETDSTIYPDEAEEKASRAEFMSAFSSTMQSLMPMLSLGPEAVSVAGGVFKFALAPYRVGRELEGLIDDFTDQGPAIAERLQEQQGEGEDEGLAAAQMELAKAEMAKVESQTQANQANAQLKMQELQLKSAEAQTKAQQDQQSFMLEVEEAKGSIEKTAAETQKVLAEIQLAQQKLGLDAHKEQREDIKTAADIEMRSQDQAAKQEDRAIDAQFRARGEERADRQQEFTEKQPKGNTDGR